MDEGSNLRAVTRIEIRCIQRNFDAILVLFADRDARRAELRRVISFSEADAADPAVFVKTVRRQAAAYKRITNTSVAPCLRAIERSCQRIESCAPQSAQSAVTALVAKHRAVKAKRRVGRCIRAKERVVVMEAMFEMEVAGLQATIKGVALKITQVYRMQIAREAQVALFRANNTGALIRGDLQYLIGSINMDTMAYAERGGRRNSRPPPKVTMAPCTRGEPVQLGYCPKPTGKPGNKRAGQWKRSSDG